MLQIVGERKVCVPGQDVALDDKIPNLWHIAILVVEAALHHIIHESQNLHEGQGTLYFDLSPAPLDSDIIVEMLLRNLVELSDGHFLFSLCHNRHPPFCL